MKYKTSLDQYLFKYYIKIIIIVLEYYMAICKRWPGTPKAYIFIISIANNITIQNNIWITE